MKKRTTTKERSCDTVNRIKCLVYRLHSSFFKHAIKIEMMTFLRYCMTWRHDLRDGLCRDAWKPDTSEALLRHYRPFRCLDTGKHQNFGAALCHAHKHRWTHTHRHGVRDWAANTLFSPSRDLAPLTAPGEPLRSDCQPLSCKSPSLHWQQHHYSYRLTVFRENADSLHINDKLIRLKQIWRG